MQNKKTEYLTGEELIKKYSYFHDSPIEHIQERDKSLIINFRKMVPRGGIIKKFPQYKLTIKNFDSIKMDEINIKNAPEFDAGEKTKNYFEFKITEYLGDSSKFKSIKIFGNPKFTLEQNKTEKE